MDREDVVREWLDRAMADRDRYKAEVETLRPELGAAERALKAADDLITYAGLDVMGYGFAARAYFEARAAMKGEE